MWPNWEMFENIKNSTFTTFSNGWWLNFTWVKVMTAVVAEVVVFWFFGGARFHE
jgi:hypothetical protein